MAIFVLRYKAKYHCEYKTSKGLGRLFKKANIQPNDCILHSIYAINTANGKIIKEGEFTVDTIEDQKKLLTELDNIFDSVRKKKLHKMIVITPGIEGLEIAESANISQFDQYSSLLVELSGSESGNITMKQIAQILETNKSAAKKIVGKMVKANMLVKYASYWRMPTDMKIFVRNKYLGENIKTKSIAEASGKRNPLIKRTGHTDADVAADIKSVVRKLQSGEIIGEEITVDIKKARTKKEVSAVIGNSIDVDRFKKANVKKHSTTVNRQHSVKNKKKGLSNEHGKIYTEEEAKNI